MKKIKVNKEFINNVNKSVVLQKEIAKTLNVSVNWLIQAKNSNIDQLCNRVGKNWDMDKKHRFKLLLEYSSILPQYNWAKFRHENSNNEFGLAEKLRYNEKEKTIVIRKSLFNEIKKLFKKFNYEK